MPGHYIAAGLYSEVVVDKDSTNTIYNTECQFVHLLSKPSYYSHNCYKGA